MILYADTSFVVKLFVLEPESLNALRFLRRRKKPITASWFTILETANTLRVLHFRKTLDARGLRAALARLDDAVTSGSIVVVPISASDLALKAEALSERHAGKTVVRTLDLLHVAAALLLRATDFLTYDERQQNVARLAGLNTVAASS